MNIVLIIIDTLRYDYVGANGNVWIETPNLDRLAARSWVFDRSYSASYPTIPHRTDVITGKYGGPIFPWRPLRWDHRTFPELLAENGYCTQLIHDTPHLVNGGHNFDYPFQAWTQVRGAEVDRPWIDEGDLMLGNWEWDPLFDVFDKASIDSPLMRTYCRANRGRRRNEDWNCARLFRTASQWLEANRNRDGFFLWVDCFDPHEPWDSPPEYAAKYVRQDGYNGTIDPRGFANRQSPAMPEAGKERIAGWYAGKVSWMDHCLGGFLDTLEQTGLDERTAVILTADHGTNIGEWGRFVKSFPVHEQEAHTPFMVSVPDSGVGRSAVVVQPQDIFATVLGIAGVAPQEGFGIESYDVLRAARRGESGAREIGLSGVAAGERRGEDAGGFFTVFGDEYYLVFAPDPERSVLVRYGTQENAASANPAQLQRLHAAGLAELERRGAAPALVDWLRHGAPGEPPADCPLWEGYPGPPGYVTYFHRMYGGA